ncbi:methyltransferase-like protein 25 isoform X3 [Acyrthosiphon pisum]|uniref:Methyltransferase domain-containing protein n=1 Tax=Acyrthosiphon pisum TaxID=7029 RepID=A0A8R2NN27_ACYPI|nr:methyltransferase-like protein 25 isoform X3 [Acyrthosiphon pisum]|eukprot:XP_008187459.1 PREDICTED: methyltransferase-like protein 25 isoform X2 [Acyrthosiphon pisum]
MEQLRSKLEEVIIYLKPYLPIANSHVVNFITHNFWETIIPRDIQEEIDLKGTEFVFSNFWSENQIPDSLTHFVTSTKYNNLNSYPSSCYMKLDDAYNVLKSWGYKPMNNSLNLKEFMGAKKMHEVEVMAKLVADFSKYAGTDVIIDIGGGKGYLSSLLALAYNFNVLGIDSQSINSEGARNRTIKFEKYWQSIKKKSNNFPEEKLTPPIIKEKLDTYEEYYEKYSRKSAVLGSTYKQITEYVTENTNIAHLAQTEFEVNNKEEFTLIGLHTCGSLEFTNDPFWDDIENELNKNESYGFPVSNCLREKKFQLGRDARMCASQSPDKFFNSKDIINSTKPLFYRALLQVYLVQELGHDNISRCHVGRLAHKCLTFNEYVHKAVKRLQLNIEIDNEKINAFYDKYLIEYERLKVFFILKQALAQVIEGLIIMDRLLYLHEQGINEAFVAKLFDPLLSPRNHAIIALKKN